jgi:Protein of unknown function (DUF3224)
LVKAKIKKRILAVIAICVAIRAGVWVTAAQEKEGAEMMAAKGPFDVKLTAVDTAHKDEKAIMRYSIDKIYHGDLEGTGAGEMLASGNGKGSGTYVAMEIVSGTLAGKKGTFALAHIGTQAHGNQNLSITVVPDTGTGELVGLAGKMNIIIAADGKHSYEFEYKIEKQ